MKQYIFDGSSFKDLDGFFVEFGKMVNGDGGYFGRTLDSFDDCLFGGFGMENPCVIIWQNCSFSKMRLGHDILFNWCKERIQKKEYLDEDGLNYLTSRQEEAKNLVGPTMFDVIVEGIKSVEQRSSGKIKIELQIID
jgi:RNAse (barnase) inhibitor barstar